jgi:hypothetical protein
MSAAKIGWWGPRPLDERTQLVGRERELDELYDRFRTYHVVTLTAESGVGKTSFVNAGLRPMLTSKTLNTFIPPGLTWPEATSRAGIGQATAGAQTSADRLYRVTIGGRPDDPRSHEEVLTELADGRPVVIVLDQFEELLRYQSNLGVELLRLVGRTARDLDVPHLVIARSEFGERLRPVEVRGAAVWRLSLSELKDESVLRDIAIGPPAAADVTLEDPATKLLCGWWSDARLVVASQRVRSVGTEGLAEIGLLHFQALLWSLGEWLGPREPGDRITAETLRRFVDHCASDRGPHETLANAETWLLQDALVEYVAVSAGRLADKETVTIDGSERHIRWRNGPRLMLARVAPALTAAGFKQPQTLHSLLPQGLGDELTARVASDLVETLQKDQENVRTPAERAEARVDAIRRHVGDFVSAGLASTWEDSSALAVVQEMIDCLHAALQAMSDPEVNILRAFERPGEPIYELVHDGMGSALKQWARQVLDEPISVIGAIGRQRGRSVQVARIDAAMFGHLDDREVARWGDVDITRDASGGVSEVEIRGLGWPASATIGTHFANVRLTECDFSGASFVACTFENVTFDRCVLRGALALRCQLLGLTVKLGVLDRLKEDRLNLFTIKNPKGEIAVSFVDVAAATGVFIEGVGGGKCSFVNSELRHLVVTAHGPLELDFVKSRALPLSAPDRHTNVTADDASILIRVDLVQ